jgi:hypothetical protein
MAGVVLEVRAEGRWARSFSFLTTTLALDLEGFLSSLLDLFLDSFREDGGEIESLSVRSDDNDSTILESLRDLPVLGFSLVGLLGAMDLA